LLDFPNIVAKNFTFAAILVAIVPTFAAPLSNFKARIIFDTGRKAASIR
jgi:hypothetical protein